MMGKASWFGKTKTAMWLVSAGAQLAVIWIFNMISRH